MEKYGGFVVIEVTDIEQGMKVVKNWKLKALNEKITIMVDNFGPAKAKEFCDILIREY